MERVSSKINSHTSDFQAQIFRRQSGSEHHGGSGSGSGNRQQGQRGQQAQGEPEAESRLIFIDVLEISSGQGPSVEPAAPSLVRALPRPVDQGPPELPDRISARFRPGFVPSQIESSLPGQIRQRRNQALALSLEPPQSPDYPDYPDGHSQTSSQGRKPALTGHLPGALNQMSIQDVPQSLRLTRSRPAPAAKSREGAVTEAELVSLQALLTSEQVDVQTQEALIGKIVTNLPEQSDRLLGPLLHSDDAQTCFAVASKLMVIEGLNSQSLATEIVCDFARELVAADDEAAMALKLQAIKLLGNRLFANASDGFSGQQLATLKAVLDNRQEAPSVRRTVAMGLMLLIRCNIKGWDRQTLIHEFSHLILDRSQEPQTRYDVLAALALVDPQAPALKQIAASPDENPRLIALAREKLSPKAAP